MKDCVINASLNFRRMQITAELRRSNERTGNEDKRD